MSEFKYFNGKNNSSSAVIINIQIVLHTKCCWLHSFLLKQMNFVIIPKKNLKIILSNIKWEKKMDKKKRYRKSYEPIQNQNFSRKAFKYNDCGDYHNLSFGKFKYENQYRFSKGTQRDIGNCYNVFNLKSSNNREVQNVSGSVIKKICPWSEEAVEEERKRQVSDTANELKNKLKMWNTVKSEKFQVGENNCSERTCTIQCNSNKVLTKQSSEHKDNELNSVNNESTVQQLNQSYKRENNVDGKSFHVSGSEERQKKSMNGGLFKPSSHNSHSLSRISKNRQKRIQQSLIGELMAIPKANLKKLLVNPQTHPKIEQKMAQIVKENRLILAKKFRSLAESKINQQGQFICSKFVDDMEDLIDSDLAVDLCQLPPELITQISDIFQLDFDCCLKLPGVQENCSSIENVNENHNAEMTLSCDENSDLNDSNTENRIFQYKLKEVSDIKVEPQTLGNADNSGLPKDKVIQNRRDSSSAENVHSTSNVECIETNPHLSSESSYLVSIENAVSPSGCCGEPEESNICNMSKSLYSNYETLNSDNNNRNFPGKLPDNLNESSLAKKIKLETEEPNCIKENSPEKFSGIKIGCNLDERCGSKPEGKILLNLKTGSSQAQVFNMKTSASEKTVKDKSDPITRSVNKMVSETEQPVFKTVETQTDINLIEADHSQPFLGQLYSERMEKSLLREVQMIDDLLHRLNQRRFIIFLKLVGLESCNVNKNNLKTSLMQTITNSDAKLLKELSLGSNKKGETKRNLKRKKISDDLKNSSKKVCGIKYADDVNVINHMLDGNIQDPAHSRKKLGSKMGNWKYRNHKL